MIASPIDFPVCWKAEKQTEVAALRVTVSNGIWGGHEWVWALPPPEPERVWVLGMKEVAFCPLPTPWVEPQFTESYQRFSFVFFRWIIIVIALFHKAANQWPRVNGVKHSGFRVASTLYTAVLLQLQCWTFIQFPYCRYSADDCNIIALYRLRCRHLLLQERGGTRGKWEKCHLRRKLGSSIKFNSIEILTRWNGF